MNGQRSQQGPRHAPRIPFALLVTAVIGGGLALLLALNTASAANELRRHDLADRDAAVAARLQDLRNAVAASAAPGNLAAAAVELGMVPAGNPAFLVVGPDGRVTVLGHPAAANAAPLPAPAHKSKHKSKKKSTSPSKKSNSPSKESKKSPSKSKTSKAVSPKPTPTPTVTLPGGTR